MPRGGGARWDGLKAVLGLVALSILANLLLIWFRRPPMTLNNKESHSAYPLHLDGYHDYVLIPPSPSLDHNTSFTIEIQFRMARSGVLQNLIEKYNCTLDSSKDGSGYRLDISREDKLIFTLYVSCFPAAVLRSKSVFHQGTTVPVLMLRQP